MVHCGQGHKHLGRPAVEQEQECGFDVIDSPEAFAAALDASKGNIMVAMFSSPFCGPCMLVEPMVTKIAVDFESSGVNVVKVNLVPGKMTKGLKALFSEHGVKELPTFIVWGGGEEQGRVKGTRHEELRSLLESLV